MVGVLVGDVEGVIDVDGVVFADGSSKVLDSLVGILWPVEPCVVEYFSDSKTLEMLGLDGDSTEWEDDGAGGVVLTYTDDFRKFDSVQCWHDSVTVLVFNVGARLDVATDKVHVLLPGPEEMGTLSVADEEVVDPVFWTPDSELKCDNDSKVVCWLVSVPTLVEGQEILLEGVDRLVWVLLVMVCDSVEGSGLWALDLVHSSQGLVEVKVCTEVWVDVEVWTELDLADDVITCEVDSLVVCSVLPVLEESDSGHDSVKVEVIIGVDVELELVWGGCVVV